MELDGQTLLLTGLAARLSYALIFLVTWLRSPAERHLLDWCLSAALIAFGFAAVHLSGPYGTYLTPLEGLVAYTLLGTGFTVAWLGVRRLDGRRAPPVLIAVSALAPGLAYVATLLGSDRPNLAFSAMFAGLSLACAILVLDLMFAGVRRGLPSRYIAGAAFAGYLASFAGAGWLSLGETGAVSPGLGSDVFALAVDQLCSLFSNVALLALAGERARADVERLARLDSLTGLLNRRSLLADATRLIGGQPPEAVPPAVLVADIDGFKLINDHHGHAAGDRALVRFADIARATLRHDVDLVARYGGEEFVAVLPATTVTEAVAIADRLRRAVDAEIFAAGTFAAETFAAGTFSADPCTSPAGLRLTVSIGVAVVQPGDETPLPAIARADTALYAAKRAGRNCVAA